MDNSTWIAQKEVAAILGIGYDQVPRVAQKANIRRFVIPGSRPKFHKGDTEDVLAKAVRGTGRQAVAS